MSAGTKRMAPHEPAHAEPHSSHRTLAFDAGRHVTRARRLEATARTEQRREQPLIGTDGEQQRSRREPRRARHERHRRERCAGAGRTRASRRAAGQNRRFFERGDHGKTQVGEAVREPHQRGCDPTGPGAENRGTSTISLDEGDSSWSARALRWPAPPGPTLARCEAGQSATPRRRRAASASPEDHARSRPPRRRAATPTAMSEMLRGRVSSRGCARAHCPRGARPSPRASAPPRSWDAPPTLARRGTRSSQRRRDARRSGSADIPPAFGLDRAERTDLRAGNGPLLLVVGRDREAPAATTATIGEHGSPAPGLEALAEAVRAQSAEVVGLVRAFHKSLDRDKSRYERGKSQVDRVRRSRRSARRLTCCEAAFWSL